jgi:predicted PP-loop superfamily ATPase
MMEITNVRVMIEQERAEVSADCGGWPLYFRLPAARLEQPAIGDALLLSALVPAMLSGGAIRLPAEFPVSSVLAGHLDAIQRIYQSWNARLRTVALEAELQARQPSPRAAGLFYAGGVDSSYSLLVHEKEIRDLVLVFGFDFNPSDTEMAESTNRNLRFAETFAKALVAVETNHSRFVRMHGVSRLFTYGATLASVGLLLGNERCFVASGHSSINLRPDGSHPVLDPLFSNGSTTIVHDDVSVSRVQKTLAVARDSRLLENLRVCWDQPNENCGRCSKCVRTMTALRIAGVQGPFPLLTDLRAVGQMAATTEQEYVIDMLLAARARGDDEVLHQLQRGLRAQDRKEALRHLDNGLLGGRLQRWRRRHSGEEGRLLKFAPRPDLEIGAFP